MVGCWVLGSRNSNYPTIPKWSFEVHNWLPQERVRSSKTAIANWRIGACGVRKPRGRASRRDHQFQYVDYWLDWLRWFQCFLIFKHVWGILAMIADGLWRTHIFGMGYVTTNQLMWYKSCSISTMKQDYPRLDMVKDRLIMFDHPTNHS